MKRPERIEQCFTDIRDYIEELEETVDSLGHLNETMCNTAKKGFQELESRLAQVERETDAAVADLTDSSDCEYCKHEPIFHTCPGTNCHTCERDCPCARCSHRRRNGFEWRGVCEENTKEEGK